MNRAIHDAIVDLACEIAKEMALTNPKVPSFPEIKNAVDGIMNMDPLADQVANCFGVFPQINEVVAVELVELVEPTGWAPPHTTGWVIPPMHGELDAWQTGREYSNHGQRIAYAILSDNRIMFADIDRNICGITTLQCGRGWLEFQKSGSRGFLLRCYDQGNYTSGAWDFQKKYKPDDLDDLMDKLKSKAAEVPDPKR